MYLVLLASSHMGPESAVKTVRLGLARLGDTLLSLPVMPGVCTGAPSSKLSSVTPHEAY